MSTQVVLEFPGELPEEILHDPDILKEGKTAIVLKMLRKGAISQEKAADLLEIDQEALLDLMEKYETSGVATAGVESEDPIAATAGAWKDLLDCKAFERDIYESRRRPPRRGVRL